MSFRVLLVALTLLLLSGLASARDPRGSVTGVVLDPVGSRIPNAAVLVINMGAGLTWTWVASRTTVLDASVAWHWHNHGNRRPAQAAFKPTDIGMPAGRFQRAVGSPSR